MGFRQKWNLLFNLGFSSNSDAWIGDKDVFSGYSWCCSVIWLVFWHTFFYQIYEICNAFFIRQKKNSPGSGIYIAYFCEQYGALETMWWLTFIYVGWKSSFWWLSLLHGLHGSGNYLYIPLFSQFVVKVVYLNEFWEFNLQNHRQRGAYIGICCLPIDGRWFQFSYQVLDKLKCFLWLKNLILKNHLLIEFWRINWSLICSILKMEALNMFCGGRRGKCACPNLAWGW